MDAALDQLDGPLLAAAWCRAVLAANPEVIVVLEAEIANRGHTGLSLVAATQQKPTKFADTVAQSQKNIRENKKWDTGYKPQKGGTKKENVGKGKFRRKSGAGGGGRFTSADDPEAIAEGEVNAGREEQKGLAAERKARTAQRRTDDENARRTQFEEETAGRDSDAAERAAQRQRKLEKGHARAAEDKAEADLAEQTRQAKAARKAVEDADDADIGTRLQANATYETSKKGEILLATKLLAEARQLRKDDDVTRLTKQIADANIELAKTQEDGRTLRAEQSAKRTGRAQRDRDESSSEAEGRRARTAERTARRRTEDTVEADETARASEARAARTAEQRLRREADRRTRQETRAAEDAEHEARAEELRARIEDARLRKKEAAASKRKSRKVAKPSVPPAAPPPPAAVPVRQARAV